MTWQNRGNCKGQISGRGPGFPISPVLPRGFTHDHLTGLREVAYDPEIQTLISNPVKELVNLRNGACAAVMLRKLCTNAQRLFGECAAILCTCR